MATKAEKVRALDARIELLVNDRVRVEAKIRQAQEKRAQLITELAAEADAVQ